MADLVSTLCVDTPSPTLRVLLYATQSVREEVTTVPLVNRGLIKGTLLYFALLVRKMEKGRG